MQNNFFLPTSVLFLFVVFLLTQLLFSCKDDAITTNSSDLLTLTADTITFDTVFTRVGSTTAFMTVQNEHNKNIKTDIVLAGGENSQFRLNVDGVPGFAFEDVEILDNDSLYLFVEVTVDPNDKANPFIMEDSIIFMTNGNEQKVLLLAYGQNAIFFNDVEVCNETLTDELPYVFYNRVYVFEDCEMNIEEGARIYMHKTTSFIIEGTLNINGTKDSMVTFQGDRLEQYFDDKSAQWNGIELARSGTANVKHAKVRGSFYGFVTGLRTFQDDIIPYVDYNLDNAPELNLENTIIENCFLNGIVSIMSKVSAVNTLIHTSGDYLFASEYGGEYDFVNCTFANYGSSDLAHRDEIIAIGANAIDFGDEDMSNIISAPADYYFGNCIIHGSEDEELAISESIEGQMPVDVLFENCVLRTEKNIDSLIFVNCIKNPDRQDTLFVNRQEWNYRLNNESPAIDFGSSNLSEGPEVPIQDLDDRDRADGKIDAGCFEFSED